MDSGTVPECQPEDFVTPICRKCYYLAFFVLPKAEHYGRRISGGYQFIEENLWHLSNVANAVIKSQGRRSPARTAAFQSAKLSRLLHVRQLSVSLKRVG